MDPAEFLNFKSETQENIDNCLTKIWRVLLCKVETQKHWVAFIYRPHLIL